MHAHAPIVNPIATIANDNGALMINVNQEQYYGFIKVQVVYTSGTVTTLKVTYGAKGL